MQHFLYFSSVGISGVDQRQKSCEMPAYQSGISGVDQRQKACENHAKAIASGFSILDCYKVTALSA